jgi:hypothetical protein
MLVSDEVSNRDIIPSKIKISGRITYFLIPKICHLTKSSGPSEIFKLNL